MGIYWNSQGKLEPGGWFYSTVENMYYNTRLSKHQQLTACKELEAYGIIEIKYYPKYGILEKEVLRLLQSSSKKATRGMDSAIFSSAGLGMSRLQATIKNPLFGNDDWIINNGYTYSLKNRRNGMQKQITIEKAFDKNICMLEQLSREKDLYLHK